MFTQNGRKWIFICMASLLLFPVIFACAPKEAEKPQIVVGILGPMKFYYGEHFWMAAQMARDEINEAGGIRVGDTNYMIELKKADSNEIESIPDAVGAMERLITIDNVDFVMGGWRSEAVMAMQEVVSDNKVIYVTSGCASPEVTARIKQDYDRYKYTFRPQQGNTMVFLVPTLLTMVDRGAWAIRNELGIEKPKVALVIDKISAFDPLVPGIKRFEAGLGIEIVGDWRPAITDTDLTGILTGIKSAGAHLIVPGMAAPSGVPFSRQWGELRIPAMISGGNMMSQRPEHWDSTGGLCNYEVTMDTIARVERTPLTIPYWDKFVSTYKNVPNLYSTVIYEGFYVLKEAIERADTLDTDALIVSLENTDRTGVAGRIKLQGPQARYPHDAQYGPELLHWFGLQWQDGKLLTVWPDGEPAMRDDRWDGIKYEGTVDMKVPPWVVEYWKDKL